MKGYGISEPIIKATALAKTYHEKDLSGSRRIEALQGLSFTVHESEIFGIIGPNGAGKTTMLHILLGMITPTSGSFSIFGLDGSTKMSRIKESINFSSTYLSLPFSLTVGENLRVSAGLYGIRDYKQRVADLMELMEISHLKNHLTKGLSSGQLSRLLLAKSLLNRPRVLFLDEPTASLDPLFANRVRSILLDVRREMGCTMMFSSHNMPEMEQLADRVLFINKGKMAALGKPQELLESHHEERLEELFLKLCRQGTQENSKEKE